MGVGLGIASTGLSIFQAISQADKAKKVKEEINNFQRQDLINPAENIKLSTLRAENLTDANLSQGATSVEALQRGGTRAIVGGLPRINENNILVQNAIAQDLAEQDARRSVLIARGEEQIQATIEQRETNALLGLGQELQNTRQGSQDAINSALGGSLFLTRELDGFGFGNGDNDLDEDIMLQTQQPQTPN